MYPLGGLPLPAFFGRGAGGLVSAMGWVTVARRWRSRHAQHIRAMGGASRRLSEGDGQHSGRLVLEPPGLMVINVENEILGSRFNSQVIQNPEKLCPVVCAVIGNVKEDLPHEKIFVFFWFLDRLIEQYLIS